MKKQTLILLLFSSLFLTYCTVTKKATATTTPNVMYTYTADVAPIILDRCTPCHFPQTGKKKWLDTQVAVSANIDDILRRVELPHDDPAFMPFKSKKEPLSDSLINVLVVWKEQGMK